MDSRESIATLYATLIGAGATIFAFVGAFLLPLLTDVKSARKVRTETWKRFMADTEEGAPGTRPGSEAPGAGPTPQAIDHIRRSREELEAHLNEEERSQLDVYAASFLALMLIGACVVAPAIGLWTLPSDDHYRQRSMVCIFGFGMALTGIPAYLFKAMWTRPDETLAGALGRRIAELWSLVLNAIVTLCFVYVVFAFADLPDLWDFIR